MPAAGIPLIPKGFTQPIFIEVCVPYGQPAGNYSGQIVVSADSGPLVSVPVSLEVWAIDLPRLYNLTARDLDDEPLEELSPLGFCAALAERKGYRLARGRGALDVHRAGLEVLRDCVDGAVCLAFVDPPAAVPIA